MAALIALPIGLSGCEKKPEAQKVEAPKAEASADGMGDMAMPADAKMAEGAATSLDAAAGKITLDHEAIAAAGEKADFDLTVIHSLIV